jgi:hypothetical protein
MLVGAVKHIQYDNFVYVIKRCLVRVGPMIAAWPDPSIIDACRGSGEMVDKKPRDQSRVY